MLELGAGADILRSLSWLYIGLIAVLVVLALWLPSRWWQKLICVIAVLLVFTGPAYMRSRERSQIVDEGKARYEAAKALFDERCKTAGEKIHKTVENVEGVQLLSVRRRASNADRADPGWIYAALPDEASEDWYIRSFLFWEHLQDGQGQSDANRAARSYLNATPSPYPGYRFVDAKESNGSFQRYVLVPKEGKLEKSTAEGQLARYAVSFSSIDTSDVRQHWIAGAKVIVTDTQSSEVLAEGTWYAFDPGLGNTDGGRSPWGFAKVCPQSGHGASPTRFFVNQVLKPKQGE
ncbi:hypothetical protein [Variovorax sp. JS1663]|uniref:hypothetical protein n=1 Tax=Variovorax sp. JS1663 TaxID=1851577 RepID=UPI00117D6A26|nr:hypothetical protein [Variovorax sp. JS1663]